MKSTHRSADIHSLLVASVVCVSALIPVTYGQEEQLGAADKTAASLLQEMEGTWDVEQKMWLGAGIDAIELPPTVARRRLVEGAYLEEVMELAQKSEQGAFARTALINCNAVNQQYEYFSMDSRAPQQMSVESENRDKGDTGPPRLKGGSFVAAQWGSARSVAFKYRLTVGKVDIDRQVVQLYLTPQGERGGEEFQAFEYVYTRKR